jgi:hypothetical protein
VKSEVDDIWATTATETSAASGYCTATGKISGVSTFDDSNCVYTPAVAEVTQVDAQCAVTGGTVGAKMFPDAKKLAVGIDNVKCTTDCETKGVFMGNCTKVAETFSVEGLGASSLGAQCNTCWDHWQNKVVDDVKGNLWPATIAVFSLFLFVLVLVGINMYMIDNQEDDEGAFAPDGIFKLLGFAFNGVVGLFGLIVLITGSYVWYDLSQGCPDGESCTNSAVIGLVILGVCVLLTAIVSLVGIILGGGVGMLMLRVANIIFLVCSLFLLICGIAFAIIAGALDETNKQYEDNFDNMRAQYESQTPNACHGLTDDECRAKIKAAAASSNTMIVILLGIICLSFLFVMFLTLEAFYIYKSGSDDDDAGEDEDAD